MKKRLGLALTAVLIVIIIASVFVYLGQAENKKPFYVGVTYGGDNFEDAKALIDKVKDYTNLFVLNSGPLMTKNEVINEIGDYAVAKGLHFAVTTSQSVSNATWLSTAEQRWSNMFAGVYFEDEPGGKMLDGTTSYYYASPGISLMKYTDGRVSYYDPDTWDFVEFYPNGTIFATRSNSTYSSITDPDNSSITIWSTLICRNSTTYKPNGSITVEETIVNSTGKQYIRFYDQDLNLSSIDTSIDTHILWPIQIGDITTETLRNNVYTMENSSDRIAQEETYQQMISKNPMSDCNGAANLFVNQTNILVTNLKNQWNITKGSFPVFTSDYGLYWWDFQSGYDLVLAQLGWNNTVAQEIGLVRGAANLQGKDWGTILTWKYTQTPYLTDGEEIYEQMKTSYECGAEYVVVFNYAEDMVGPYGTLQEEHFQALERFWNEVVKNPTVVNGGVKAEAALVLPADYGWGMRNQHDTIWGLWNADSTSQQIWTQLQSKLQQYGSKLDIVYDEPAYPVTGKYSHIFYWNQTG